VKRKAILSNFWGAHFEALRQFLLMHEPMVVISPRGLLSSDMQAQVTQTGGSIVWLEDFCGAHPEETDATRGTRIARECERNLATRETIAGLPQQGANGRLSNIIVERLNADLPAAIGALDNLAKASDEFDIVLLATSEEVTCRAKVITAWAKAHGIPSLHLAHAIPLVDPYTVHDQLLADKLAVFGRRGMEGYLDLGVPEERMVATGNPAWDIYSGLRKKKDACRQHINTKYVLDPMLPLVVFGTTWAANLSAFCNADVFGDSVQAFFTAIRALRAHGIEVNAVIKDRPANSLTGEQTCAKIHEAMGLGDLPYRYAVDDTQLFAAAATVLVAVDSNYLVEAMLAGTPAINLMNPSGQLMGPCFEAESGILEAESAGLADAIARVLTDDPTRSAMLDMAARRTGYYNFHDGDGLASVRVAQAMAQMTKQLPLRRPHFVWKECLDVASGSVEPDYHTVGRADLAAMYSNTPAIILDVGCAAGSTAALLKQRFPRSRVWGIELNKAAAQLASRKLDRVLVGKFEDFDLEKEGIVKGTLDAVLLADVLEHMYNPWDVMVRLRPFMSPTGQVLISIPNVRNLLLMDELSKGNFTYASSGLLDITHIRFFTFKEILRFCKETGYRVIATQNAIDLRLSQFFKENQAKAVSDINMDRITLRNVTREELIEFCTIQFHCLLERDAAAA
jgi:2-polyprenyl-3-methyl-5-hydroxy-6-metoxy-1,4-benzoquinol methylase